MKLRSPYCHHGSGWISDERWGSGSRDNIQKSGIAEHKFITNSGSEPPISFRKVITKFHSKYCVNQLTNATKV